MAQVKLTDFYPQNKKAKRGPLSAKRRAAGVDGGVTARTEPLAAKPRQSRRKLLERPAATAQTRASSGGSEAPVISDGGNVCKSEPTGRGESCAILAQEPGVDKRVPALEYLVTPSKDKRTAAEFDLGSDVFGADADGLQSSSAKKRCRYDSVDGTDQRPAPKSGPSSQRPDGVRSARRSLVLQPREEETRVPEKTKPKQTVPGGSEPRDLSTYEATALRKAISKPPGPQNSNRTNQQTSTTPGKEGLLSLKAQLQRIQKLDKTATSFAPTSELNSDIKRRLKRVKELELKVQEKKAEREKATEQESTLSIDERAKAPAFQRFHNLAQDIPPGLTLPFKYKLLAEMFRSMDTVVSILFNRSETVTFAKVKQGVQDMTRKQFEKRNVGQIKTIYPSAYKFRQEKGIPTWSDSLKRSSYQLTLDPVFEGEENSDGRTQLTASRLLLRRRIFSRNLVNIVKQYHKVFLASLNPPMHVPNGKLTRWHPRFNVDEIPDITAAELPQPPDLEKLTTAQEVLDKARSVMTPKMEKALANMALKTVETAMAATTEQKKEPNVVSPCLSPGASNALKGVSQSLLERIRAKEAQKMQAAMTRSPAQTERLHMMLRLPEITRILRNVFVAEKKPALIIAVACNRVVDSYRSAMALDDMEKHLRLLADVVPDWLSIHPIRKDVYLKLNKNMELNVVAEKIAKKMREEEQA
ncbi:DNA replication factor Cdt1 [Heptranchias perlo]|uniref:DNA replication factor Cdt1 n=1 Tax=Heptranchias perlo TaxID=212740 RepID=UPI003559581D